MLISTAYAASISTPIRLFHFQNELHATLNFFNMMETGNQNLSVVVFDAFNELIANATVFGNVTDPDGNITFINYTEHESGNYTNFFLFDKIGNYNIDISAAKTGFDNITGNKTIYVGLVKITSFTTDSPVFQGSSTYFDVSLQNIGNVSTNVTVKVLIFNPSGTQVATLTGITTELGANTTQAQVQRNFLRWDIPNNEQTGTHTAKTSVTFINPSNNAVQIPNITTTFEVRATAVSVPPETPSGGGGGGGAPPTVVINITEKPNITLENILFTEIPILTELYPGDTKSIALNAYNPSTVSLRDVEVKITGVQKEWVMPSKELISIPSFGSTTVLITYTIPTDVIPGNYYVTITLKNGMTERSFVSVLRIFKIIEDQEVRVIKTAIVNEVDNRTDFTITIKNTRKIDSLQIIETINKSIADHVDKIIFNPYPTTIRQADPVVEWMIQDIKPLETVEIKYFVTKAITNFRIFMIPSIEQIIILIPEEIIREIQRETLNITFIAIFAIMAVIMVIIVYITTRSQRKIFEKIKEIKKTTRNVKTIEIKPKIRQKYVAVGWREQKKRKKSH